MIRDSSCGCVVRTDTLVVIVETFEFFFSVSSDFSVNGVVEGIEAVATCLVAAKFSFVPLFFKIFLRISTSTFSFILIFESTKFERVVVVASNVIVFVVVEEDSVVVDVSQFLFLLSDEICGILITFFECVDCGCRASSCDSKAEVLVALKALVVFFEVVVLAMSL